MTIETLQDKRADLEKQKHMMIANINAIDGALQLLDQLIQEESNPLEPEAKPVIRQ